MSKKTLNGNQLLRMPAYLVLLNKLKNTGLEFVSTQTIADCLKTNNEKVRKDIAAVSSEDGIPNKGRRISTLIDDIELILGYKTQNKAILIGVGNLGKAILKFKGFENYGLEIVAGFDTNPQVIGKEIKGHIIEDFNLLDKSAVSKYNASIAILCVPEDQAQEVANKLINCGISGIWNFAAPSIIVPQNVLVSNVNIAASLSALSHELYLKELEER